MLFQIYHASSERANRMIKKLIENYGSYLSTYNDVFFYQETIVTNAVAEEIARTLQFELNLRFPSE